MWQRIFDSRRQIFYFLFILLITIICAIIFGDRRPPPPPLQPIHKINLSNLTASIAYYTLSYGTRIHSKSNLFHGPLKAICETIDPEYYQLADSVIVSIVDFIQFPTINNDRNTYRTRHAEQLWLFYAEESPRNSYRTVKVKNITYLDDWFNLTATLKPESDVHIQYKGYRIKPHIGELIEQKLNISLKYQFKTMDLLASANSVYLNLLGASLHEFYLERETHSKNNCPYNCNQPLNDSIVELLKPFLPSLVLEIKDPDKVYIAWFVSNCDSHSGREEYVHRLRLQPGIHVDIYGNCASKLNSHIIPIQCKKGTPNCLEKTLKHYRFYLSFENSKCDTYITEKYWMQGASGLLVPIVLGARREHYRRIAVPNSYLHADDYPKPEDLAKKLYELNRNETLYNEYLLWTQLYDVDYAYSPTTGYDMHTTTCLLSHYRRVHSMVSTNENISPYLQQIRQLFDLGKRKVPDFDWETARTKSVKISEFYNPKVNCWDNEYPSLIRRIYNYLFGWWVL